MLVSDEDGMENRNMSKQKSAKIMLSVSMIIFGTLGVFTRNIGVTSGELALYRAILAALLLAGYFLVTKQKIEFKAIKKALVLLLLSGVAMGINWILLFEAYKYTTISAATLSYYFAPVIVFQTFCFISFLLSNYLTANGYLKLWFKARHKPKLE